MTLFSCFFDGFLVFLRSKFSIHLRALFQFQTMASMNNNGRFRTEEEFGERIVVGLNLFLDPNTALLLNTY